MSGRRRRDDGWDDGRRDGDARDNRPDPWSADGADGGQGRGYPAPSFQPLSEPTFQPLAEPATSYDLAAGQTANGNGYNSSSFGGSGGGGAGYGAQNGAGYGGQNGAGYGGQNGAANGYQNGAASGYQTAQPAPGYGGAGYGDSSGYGQGGYGFGNDAGYGGRSGFANPNGATAYVPEFMSDDLDDEAQDAPAGTPRPIGRLSIYTLLDDRVAEFDRLAERAAEGVRTTEPDTLVYVIHVVPKAPMQRIMYEIYRDRAAFESHERQPHIQLFIADRASCVLATNIIDLRLKYAKVTALGGAPVGAQSPDRGLEAQPAPRSLAAAGGGDQSRSERYSGSQYGNASQYTNGSATQYDGSATQYDASATQYGAGTQYNGAGQYGSAQTTAARAQYPNQAAPAAAAPAASFTPADDRYGTASQYPASASDQYAATGQYGYPSGAAAANGGQYSAAAATAYPATSGYSETGAYPGTGYQAAGSYQASGGYQATATTYQATPTTYQATGGYSAGAGYSGGGGYSGGAGGQAGDGYQAANGYAGSDGYSGTANRASFTPVGSAGAASGQSTVAAQVAAARRYRELGSGAPADDAGGYQAPGEASGGGRDADGSSDSAEWASPGYSDQRYRSS
jgi:quinol monooxygenase YgiN